MGDLPYASAEAWEAARDRVEVLGPAHAEVERTLVLCASIEEQRGEWELALTALQRALYARTERLGPQSLEAADLLDRSARIEIKHNRLDEARTAAEKALTMREALLGPSHTDVARALFFVGNIETKQCRLSDAEGRLRRARAIAEAMPRADPRLVAEALDKLGEARRLARADGEAEDLWRLALDVLAPMEAMDYEWMVALHVQIAELTYAHGDRPGARARAEQALAFAERHVWPNRPDPRISPAILLAGYLSEGGDAAGAEALLTRVGRKKRTWQTSALPSAPSLAARTDKGPRCVPPSGSSDASNVAQVVAGMGAGFQSCYSAALRQDRRYKPSLRLTAKIGAGGEVNSVSTVVLLRDPDSMMNCLLKVVASSQFNPPEGGGATIVIPVHFMTK